jgi:hypothetical protein
MKSRETTHICVGHQILHAAKRPVEEWLDPVMLGEIKHHAPAHGFAQFTQPN